MNLSSGVLVLPANKLGLIAAAAAIAMIFLAPNFTITNAQQLPQTSQQSSSSPSPTLLNSKDSFRVKLPAGWVIQDINNTGFILAAEVLQGYGLLAQLCPQQGEEQYVSSNLSSTATTGNRYIGSCQYAGEEVIHIIRYPNLGARLGIPSGEDVFNIIKNWGTVPNATLAYHLQKLQEAGYRDFKIINSMDTTINVDNSTGLDNGRRMATTTTIPAKLVEITYSTNPAPNETKRGYFILTATVATPRNLGVMTGYSIFYEGSSTATTLTGDTAATISHDSTSASPISMPASLPPPVRQVFDSFELVAAPTAEPLTAEITSDETEGIAPATFEFEAELSGGVAPYTIKWDFGDGSSGTGNGGGGENEETIEHTYDIAGVYNARVSVTDSTGRTASDTILIIVDEPPPLTSVDIISNATEGIAPATFEFEANVIGGIEPYSYRWNFGDGSRIITDDDEDIVHTFDIAGMYNISLIVIDSTGRAIANSMLIIVDEPPPPPPLRLIEIISNATEGIAPATFEFEANVIGGIEPYSYRWNFGDGSRESGNDETIEHTFEEAGTYNVSLIVIDSAGRTAYDSILITIEPPSPPPLTSVDIISNATEGIAPATFEFEANVIGGIEPYSYRWNFGDGSGESNRGSVVHTFDIAGTYNVSLIVTDNQNQIAFDNIVMTIEELQQPQAIEQEQPISGDINNGPVSNDSLGLADLIDRLEQRNNNNVVAFGGTSAADDYDATADD